MRVAPAWALVAACVSVLAGCKQPVLRDAGEAAQEVGGPAVRIEGATVQGNRVVVSLRVTKGGAPVATREELAALAPTFTVAALSEHPVDGLASWRSLLLTGWQVAQELPPAGPGTPPEAVLSNVRQPGYEGNGTLAGGDGAFTYTFASALPADFSPGETLRVGVWLAGTAGTPRTTATHDFRPAGGAASPRDTVLDANCNRCHGAVRAHGGYRVGVKICLTCHTWQLADPDTVDPAALPGATAATDPNPLDLGRLVHRIHRGRDLPTLYRSSSTAPAPDLATADVLPAPFFPGRNAPVAGRKYSVVGYQSHEYVYGRVVERTSLDGGEKKVVAEGVVYPRDLRDCDSCHGGAPQEHEVLYGVSRRTCQGCHPETWFGAEITGDAHFAHPGGPQADDGDCRGCHVAATAAQPKVWAPIAEIHVPPHRSRHFDRPVVEIVGVRDLRPDLAPKILFRLHDRVGSFEAVGAYPAPAPVPGGSILPRTMHYLAGGWFGITVAGPTVPAFGQDYLLSERAPNPSPFSLVPDANGVFTYEFASKVPASASGTWAVGIEARRSGATTRFDPVAREFRWPYTGETLTEPPLNPVVYVDTSTGTFTAGVADAAVPRRRVVAQEKCDRCHDPIPVHGRTRMRVEYCLLCHGPDRTDWAVRPGVAARPGVPVTGSVNLAATFDGVEERSLDLKVMIHRIHTGGRRGAASLEGIGPHVLYGRYNSVFFFDHGLFPDDLRNCTACHEGRSYAVDAVPADAPPTRANETSTILHGPGAVAHPDAEPGVPPIQAACMGCHATSATASHAARNTAGGVEQCASCHVRGALSVDAAHGLAAPDAPLVAATYSAIARDILVPRCASAACHGGNPPAYFPQLDADVAWEEMVGKFSEQASGVMLVKPFAPEESYLLVKSRGDGASLGGVGTPMPIGDAALTPSELAAIEAWIANGAPND